MEDRSESDRASARGAPGIVFEEGVDQRVPEDRLGDIDSGFFSRFANCSLDDAFAVIEEAAGKGPKTFAGVAAPFDHEQFIRSEEHTSELQSLMRISYAVFCLTKKKLKTQ